jgi:hypothetical protein
MNLPIFWKDWAAIGEAAENLAEKDAHAESTRKK